MHIFKAFDLHEEKIINDVSFDDPFKTILEHKLVLHLDEDFINKYFNLTNAKYDEKLHFKLLEKKF